MKRLVAWRVSRAGCVLLGQLPAVARYGWGDVSGKYLLLVVLVAVAVSSITSRSSITGEKQVTFRAELVVTASAPSLEARFLLDRETFGVSYEAAADNLTRADVVAHLDIKAQSVLKS